VFDLQSEKNDTKHIHRYWKELPEAELLSLRDSGYLWSEVCTDGKAVEEVSSMFM
jgi:hypothetical protein